MEAPPPLPTPVVVSSSLDHGQLAIRGLQEVEEEVGENEALGFWGHSLKFP